MKKLNKPKKTKKAKTKKCQCKVSTQKLKVQTKAKYNTGKRRRTLEDVGVKHGGTHERMERSDEDKREHKDYSHTIMWG